MKAHTVNHTGTTPATPAVHTPVTTATHGYTATGAVHLALRSHGMRGHTRSAYTG